ncbi:Ferric/cupric reductase transmembrane component B [Fusarium oxysporum f. sp. albedinis]|nr:Ferric/cupric reductase transmembrane component B [Fusarium oxysporum f. sp. albedinis]
MQCPSLHLQDISINSINSDQIRYPNRSINSDTSICASDISDILIKEDDYPRTVGSSIFSGPQTRSGLGWRAIYRQINWLSCPFFLPLAPVRHSPSQRSRHILQCLEAYLG